MQNSQLLKFINGVSNKKSFANPQQYLSDWSNWLSTQSWANVSSIDDTFEKKLHELHKAAVDQLVKAKPTTETIGKTNKSTSISGSGEYIVQVFESETAEKALFAKKAKHHVAAQEWGFNKVAEFGTNSSFVRITDPRGKTSTYSRQDAIYATWGKRKSQMACRKVSVSTPNWQMRARNDRASFSRG